MPTPTVVPEGVPPDWPVPASAHREVGSRRSSGLTPFRSACRGGVDLQFREPCASSVDALNRVASKTIDPTIPTGRLGTAKRHTKDHFIVTAPKLVSARIHDEPMLQDALMEWRRLYKVLSTAFYLCLATAVLLCPLMLGFVPFGIMGYTQTTTMLFNATAPPFPAWTVLCVGLNDVLCVATTYGFLYALILYSSPAMVRLLWKRCWVRLTMTLGSAFAYAVAAGSLLPNPHHLLWLVYRTVVLLVLTHSDAIAAGLKLRMVPEAFAKFGGSKTGGRGWATIVLFGFGGVGFVLCDAFGHVLVVNASERTSVVDFGTTNPLTGSRFEYSNHQLAEALYFTSLIFAAQIAYAIARTHWGAETTLLTTPFVIDSGEEECQTKAEP